MIPFDEFINECSNIFSILTSGDILVDHVKAGGYWSRGAGRLPLLLVVAIVALHESIPVPSCHYQSGTRDRSKEGN